MERRAAVMVMTMDMAKRMGMTSSIESVQGALEGVYRRGRL
jgi:hypothetical protein